MGGAAELVDDVGAGSAGVLAVDAVGGGDDDEELDVTLVEVVGEQLASLGRFGGGVLEAAGRQALGDGDAEDAEGDRRSAATAMTRRGAAMASQAIRCSTVCPPVTVVFSSLRGAAAVSSAARKELVAR